MAHVVINPVSAIFMNWIKEVKNDFPEIQTVHDPSLQLETSIRNVRSIRSAFKLNARTPYPLFSYSRGIFSGNPEMRWTPAGKSAIMVADKISDEYIRGGRVMPGSFTVNFRMFTQEPAQLERYETLYMTGAFLSSLKIMKNDYYDGPPGDEDRSLILKGWTTHFDWEEIEDFQFERSPVVQMSFGGTVNFRTALVSIETEDNRLVERVEFSIRDYYSNEAIFHKEYIDSSSESKSLVESNLISVSESFFKSSDTGDEIEVSGRNLPRPLISGRRYYVIKNNHSFKINSAMDLIVASSELSKIFSGNNKIQFNSEGIPEGVSRDSFYYVKKYISDNVWEVHSNSQLNDRITFGSIGDNPSLAVVNNKIGFALTKKESELDRIINIMSVPSVSSSDSDEESLKIFNVSEYEAIIRNDASVEVDVDLITYIEN